MCNPLLQICNRVVISVSANEPERVREQTCKSTIGWIKNFIKRLKGCVGENRYLHIFYFVFFTITSVPCTLCVWSRAWELLALSCVCLSLWSFCLQHNVTTGHKPKHPINQHRPAENTNWSICFALAAEGIDGRRKKPRKPVTENLI